MAKRRRRPTAAKAAPSLRASWFAAFTALSLAIIVSGLAVVESATQTRSLYQQLGETQSAQDQLLEEHSRLSLERSTLSSLQKIEEVARDSLDMDFPEAIEGIAQ